MSRLFVLRWIYALVLVSCVGALIVAFTKSAYLGLVLLSVEASVIAIVRQMGFERRFKAEQEREPVDVLAHDDAWGIGQERAS